jgi:hypothetical protein
MPFSIPGITNVGLFDMLSPSEIFAQLENHLPEARIVDFSGHPASAASAAAKTIV